MLLFEEEDFDDEHDSQVYQTTFSRNNGRNQQSTHMMNGLDRFNGREDVSRQPEPGVYRSSTGYRTKRSLEQKKLVFLSQKVMEEVR